MKNKTSVLQLMEDEMDYTFRSVFKTDGTTGDDGRISTLPLSIALEYMPDNNRVAVAFTS